jgi:hypothetical protein
MLALALASAAAPAAAQIARRPIAIYPLSRSESSDASDVLGLLDAALHRAAQRNDDIAVAEPLVLRAACGPSASATAQCLGNLAGSGLVLRATVHKSSGSLVIALEAIDGSARSFGPVTASVDAFIQSAEPFAHAIILLVDQVIAADRRRAGRVAGGASPAAGGSVPLPPPPRTTASSAPTASAPAAPGAAEAPPPKPSPPKPPPAPPVLKVTPPHPAPAQVVATSDSAPPGQWMRTAGPVVTIAGCAALAGGVAVAVMNRSLSRSLERKYEAGTLTAADLSSYDRVERNNKLAKLLFASGGGVTLAGLAIWTAAPEKGTVVASVSGRF